MKDSKTILLALVSVLLIGSWVFHIYDKSKYASLPPNAIVADSAALKKALSDSIKQIYQATLSQMERVPAVEDSLNLQLNQKLREIDTLRSEINQILSENTITKEDLAKALLKIQQLQKQLSVINKDKNQPVKVNTVQMPVTEPGVSTVKTSAAVQGKPPVVSGSANADFLQANEVVFSATGSRGESTNQVLQAENFSISFSLRNNSNSFPGSQVYLVVKSPLGNVLQDDEWQAGVFNSRNEGSVRYSRKMNLDYNRGDFKRMNTTISIPKAGAGTYQLFIYHNGYRIARADYTLN
jgi:hypothetical protein